MKIKEEVNIVPFCYTSELLPNLSFVLCSIARHLWFHLPEIALIAKTPFNMHYTFTNFLLLCSAGLIHATVASSSCLPAYSASTTFVGCFTDAVAPRTLNGSQLADSNQNIPQVCANQCGLSGYAYAGVEYAVQCFCSKQAPIDWGASSGTKVNVSECSTPCPGNLSEFCGAGGRWVI
jgi:hypothetical protein